MTDRPTKERLTEADWTAIRAEAWLTRVVAEIDALRHDLARVEKERDKALAAISQIHQHTGRGDGHGSVTQTTLCILDAVSNLREDATETEQERDAEHAEAAETYERAAEECDAWSESPIAREMADRLRALAVAARATITVSR